MKGLKLLFAVLLAPLAFQAATADDGMDVARATTRNDAPATVSVTRKKSASNTTDTQKTISRTLSTQPAQKNVRERTNARSDSTNSRPDNSVTQKSVTARTSSNVVARPAPVTKVATTSRTASTPIRTTAVSRSATTPRAQTRPSVARATTARSATTTVDASTILSRNYGQCREVFNSCMDEFCANKDANLARCACSTRATEFESTKKSLANIEDKLLQFGERLLVVNMDAEDVNAMNQATAGELAFNNADKSQSKQMLDEIAKKLNTSFDDSNFDNRLNAINLSLDMDAAFDNVDSMLGASTTTKSGPALYNAALPVCREMAAEVCTPDELSIAESGYQMIIEQDCNTVAKTYQTQTDLARAKVFESGALLDMSRLDIYQTRNSDDILTCKNKMLNMLTDSNVCGTDLGKCLDTSGKYIDPTTGEAFLTDDLYELASLLTRPTGDEKWTEIPGNGKFITFLNSKKTFLEPAMENCQDISSYVWDEFINDALAQIKLAQDKKLEDVRQSCTTLTTQCLDTALDSISEFDARALSIFGVAADKTINAMCADIKNACTVLIEQIDTNVAIDGTDKSEWGTAMDSIALTKTYDTILSTCNEVGRQCIINTCKSITGNFGLCNSISKSVNRSAILNRTACWDDVVQCVSDAGTDAIAQIFKLQGRDIKDSNHGGAKYADIHDKYSINSPIYDLCGTDAENCGPGNNLDCATCRLAEEIWGNCQHKPDTAPEDTNQIYITKKDYKTETLLSWFATNTGTKDEDLSCYDQITCGPGMKYTQAGDNSSMGLCAPEDSFDSLDNYCDNGIRLVIGNANADTSDTWTNCCTSGETDYWGNCCEQGNTTEVTTKDYYFDNNKSNIIDATICAPKDASTAYLIASYKTDATHNIICYGDVVWEIDTDDNTNDNYPNGTTITCVGTLVDIQVTGNVATYNIPNGSISYYNVTNDNTCYSDNTENCTSLTVQHWLIDFDTQNTNTNQQQQQTE